MNIACDIDGVLAEFPRPFLKRWNKKHNTSHHIGQIVHHDFSKCIGANQEDIHSEIFKMQVDGDFLKLPAYQDVSAYTHLIKDDGHKIYIVTNRVCACDTIKWLNSKVIAYDKVFLIKGKKHIYDKLEADVIIEDNPKYITEAVDMGLEAIVFDHAWNRDIPQHERISRAHNWKEVYDAIKKIDYKRIR